MFSVSKSPVLVSVESNVDAPVLFKLGAVTACEKSNSSAEASQSRVASVELFTASWIVIPAPLAVLDVSPDP